MTAVTMYHMVRSSETELVLPLVEAALLAELLGGFDGVLSELI